MGRKYAPQPKKWNENRNMTLGDIQERLDALETSHRNLCEHIYITYLCAYEYLFQREKKFKAHFHRKVGLKKIKIFEFTIGLHGMPQKHYMLQIDKPKSLKMVMFLVIFLMELLVGSLTFGLSFLGVQVAPLVAQQGHIFAPPLQLFMGPCVV